MIYAAIISLHKQEENTNDLQKKISKKIKIVKQTKNTCLTKLSFCKDEILEKDFNTNSSVMECIDFIEKTKQMNFLLIRYQNYGTLSQSIKNRINKR